MTSIANANAMQNFMNLCSWFSKYLKKTINIIEIGKDFVADNQDCNCKYKSSSTLLLLIIIPHFFFFRLRKPSDIINRFQLQITTDTYIQTHNVSMNRSSRDQ